MWTAYFVCVALCRRGWVDLAGVLLYVPLLTAMVVNLTTSQFEPGQLWWFLVPLVTVSLAVRGTIIIAMWAVSQVAIIAIGEVEPALAHLVPQVSFILLVIGITCAWQAFSIERSLRIERDARERLHDVTTEAERARERAEAANHAKSQFLAKMSHELRTPLNAILGYSELLTEDLEDEDDARAEDVGYIHAAGRHLLELVDDVLDISKIEADRLDLHPARFSPESLIDELQIAVTPLVRQRGNALRVEVDPGVDAMVGDARRVRQILLNLLTNAAKYTEQGEIVLEVRAVAGDRVQFKVSDTGMGMESEELDHVFELFEHGRSSVARERSGAGLGLPLVRELTARLGGELEAESEPGLGSTFTVTLPRIAELEPSASAPAVA